MTERIVSTPDIRSGQPRINGTRITVRDMLEYMAAGESAETLLEDFPQLSRDDLRACLAFAAEHLGQPLPLAAE